MPHSHLSHIQFMRRLSIQPEESSNDLDEEPNERAPSPPSPSLGGNKSCGIFSEAHHHVPDDSPLLPCLSRGQLSTENIQDHLNLLDEGRKFSIASMTSIRSSSSISSTCSAPGGMMIRPGGGGCGQFSSLCTQSAESYDLQPPMTKRAMTSRPSFISLCSIVSETSEIPQRLLPAPLQVELDLMQRSGIEGDEPKCRSHLPILRCPSDYDISELDMATNETTGQLYRKNSRKGIVKGIKDFPKRMRKLSTEKNRFDVYSISDETREQLKQLYVY